MIRYVALLHEGRSEYGVSFPDFPGVVSGGATPDEALAEAAEALRFAVTEMRAEGAAVPKPRTLSMIRKVAAREDWYDMDEAIAAYVPLLPPKSNVERLNITLEKGLVDAIDAAASKGGQSRSAWIAEAAKTRLGAF
ncbi:MAG: type II toxin-antitoxin system HicB family antitoxin [Alphaproteobacteria bacterium]|nr:type II toxin-antitoxin system HicB family antitoxin [Alphaproteobacteria bacterium]